MKIFIIFLFLITFVRLENIFFDKLEKLLNYCEKNQNELDTGTLLGISIAKKILLSEKTADKIVKKMQQFEENFFISPASITELSK
jgi:hypothetical protein